MRRLVGLLRGSARKDERAGFAGPRPSFKTFSRFWVGSAWPLTTTHQAVDVAWPVEMVGAHGACASRLRRRSWSHVHEAGDGLEAAVLADDAEVGAYEVGRGI